jgi:hypothetical protein
MTVADNIEQLFKQVEAAADSFFAGDPAPVMALWSRADDVTIFGGSGSRAQGWTAVRPRIQMFEDADYSGNWFWLAESHMWTDLIRVSRGGWFGGDNG